MQVRSPTAQLKTVSLSHSAAVVSKTPVLINSRVVIPMDDAEAAADQTFLFEGVIDEAPLAAVVVTALSPCYWDNTNSVFTNVSTSNTLCGYFLEAVASGTTSGLIAFNSFA